MVLGFLTQDFVHYIHNIYRGSKEIQEPVENYSVKERLNENNVLENSLCLVGRELSWERLDISLF